MLVTKTETRTVEEVVVTDILCNQCGLSCKDDSDMNFEGLLEAKVTGGYASKLGDCTTYEFSICENCLGEMFKGFKIPPKSNGDEDFGSRFLLRTRG